MNNRTLWIILGIVFAAFACIIFFSLVAGAGLYIFSGGTRGSGQIVSESREMGGFDRISVCCGMQLILVSGQQSSLELQGDDNLLPQIRTRVSGDQLTIDYAPSLRSVRPSQPIRVTVTMPEVTGVELSGGSLLDAQELVTDRLELDASGGSLAAIGVLVAESLDAKASGGSRIAIESGTVDHQAADLSGGSSYSADDVAARTATVDVSGSSRATIWVTDSLDAQASGASTIQYYGDPDVSHNASGASRIESLGDR